MSGVVMAGAEGRPPMLLPWMACHGRNRALGRQASYIQTSGPRGLAHTRGSGVYRPVTGTTSLSAITKRRRVMFMLSSHYVR